MRSEKEVTNITAKMVFTMKYNFKKVVRATKQSTQENTMYCGFRHSHTGKIKKETFNQNFAQWRIDSK